MAHSKTIKSATHVMAAAQLVTVACRFARNVVLAWMLMPADFGVGATFAISLSFWEMITELGPRKQLVQAPEGGSTAWQGNAQLLFVVRGVLLSTILFFLAPTVAGYFEIPEAVLAFRLLAIVPLVRGFIHCDVFRYQRDLQLGRLAVFQSIPPVLGVLSAPLFAYCYGDYHAFLGVILTESILGSLLSHLVAQRAYRWSFQFSIVERFVGFGWPLIGNGLLLFSVMHGDRFLIASYFDLDMLGAFSVVFALMLTPTLALANLHGSIALPLFSRSRDDSKLLHNYCWQSAQIMCLLAGLLATLSVTAGPWLVATIYGQRYLLATEAIPWIGLMCAMRLARTTASMAAVAHGETKIPLLSNFARAASFLVAWELAARGFGLTAVPICGFVGELCAYGISVLLVSHRCRLRKQVFFGPMCLVAAFVLCARLIMQGSLPTQGIAPPLVASLWLIALVAYCGLIWPTLRSMAFAMLRAN